MAEPRPQHNKQGLRASYVIIVQTSEKDSFGGVQGRDLHVLLAQSVANLVRGWKFGLAHKQLCDIVHSRRFQAGFFLAIKPEPPEKKGAGERSGKSASDNGWQDTAVLLARISGIGWYVAGSIGLGVGLGWWLDRQFDTQPVLTLIGLGIGILAAFTGMIRLLNAIGKKKQ